MLLMGNTQTSSKLDSFIESFEKRNNDSDKSLASLQKVNNQLLKENKRLLEEINQLKEGHYRESNNSKISRSNVREYVNKMLENDDANIDYLPDYVESKIYENVFVLILGLLQGTTDQTTIDVIGHKLRIQLTKD